MKKNQARGNEQCRAASLIVLHAIRAERSLLVGAGNVFRIRRLTFGGKEFTNVIQFIS
jgi:hypothetical protein